MFIYKKILALALLTTLVACGSDSDSDSDNTVSTSKGVFVDSPVSNIGYKTETLEGLTNAEGEYDYIEGETVTFFIGDLILPPVKAQGIVTPLDLAGTTDTEDNKVINMLRLLQTLDKDGDPSNGITITDEAKAVATAIDFDQPIETFAALPAIIMLVKNAALDTPLEKLISKADALAHFEAELIKSGLVAKSLVGTWIISDTTNYEVQLLSISFFKDGTYLHNEIEGSEVTEPENGMEWGSYEYNKDTKIITVGEAFFDGNGGLGFVDEEEVSVELLATVEGDTLTVVATYEEEGEQESDTLIFDRVVTKGIVGTWLNPNTEYDLLSFTFFADGTYIHSEVGGDEYEGMEWGTYVRDAVTGELSIMVSEDNNGWAGLSDFEDAGSVAVNVVDGMLMLSIDEDGEQETLAFYNQYVTIPAPKFTEANFTDKAFTFIYPDDEAEEVTLIFDEEGEGTISFEGDDFYDEFDITWEINANGELEFYEEDDPENYWDWTFTPVKIKSESLTVDVVIMGVDGGEPVGDSFTKIIELIPPRY